jgi:hypothetical protein
MTIIITTMFWGSVIPILFPLCFVSLLIHYYKEKLMLHYSYQRPPVYSGILTRETVLRLYIAPIFYCFTSAWALSNPQVFGNKIVQLDPDYVFPLQQHYVLSWIFDFPNPSSPIFLAGIFYSVVRIYMKRVDKGDDTVANWFCRTKSTEKDLFKKKDFLYIKPYSEAIRNW